MTVLMQQVDVGKVLDLLTMFKEAGLKRSDIDLDEWLEGFHLTEIS